VVSQDCLAFYKRCSCRQISLYQYLTLLYVILIVWLLVHLNVYCQIPHSQCHNHIILLSYKSKKEIHFFLTLQMVFKSNLSCKIFYQLKKKQTKYEMPYCLYHFVLYIVHVYVISLKMFLIFVHVI
jgi:hypothetical protein